MSEKAKAKKLPTRYEASDGQEFDTEAEAERHSEFVDAKRKYENAKLCYMKVVCEREKTADGEPFNFTMMHDYFIIRDYVGSIPHLERVSFYLHNCTIEDDRQRLEIIQTTGDRRQCYPICQLYYREREANRELVKIRRKRLAEMMQETDEMEKKLEGGR